jgi:hypothetical protein
MWKYYKVLDFTNNSVCTQCNVLVVYMYLTSSEAPYYWNTSSGRVQSTTQYSFQNNLGWLHKAAFWISVLPGLITHLFVFNYWLGLPCFFLWFFHFINYTSPELKILNVIHFIYYRNSYFLYICPLHLLQFHWIFGNNRFIDDKLTLTMF